MIVAQQCGLFFHRRACSHPAERVHLTYRYVLLNTCCIIAGEGMRLAIVLDALHAQASPFIVGVLGSLFSVIPALSSVASGRWVDRVGVGRPMLMAAGMMAAGAALAFVWRDLAALFVVSIVVGTFANLFFVATFQVLGSDEAPGARVRNFSILTTANSVGTFISPLLVGFGIDTFGYPATFLLLALLSLGPAVFIAFGGLSDPRQAPSRDTGPQHGSTPPADDRPSQDERKQRSAFGLLRIPALRRLFGIAFATSASVLLYMFLVPLLGVQRGLSASWIGFLLSSFSLTMAVVRVFTPALARLLPPWQLILGALSASGAMLLLLPLTDNTYLLLAISLFLGASLGLSSPIILSQLSEVSPPGRVGEALGLRMTMVNLILTVVPLVAGTLGALLGIAPVFWIISLILLGSCTMARRQWHAPRARPGSR